jgi:hypothetical protein
MSQHAQAQILMFPYQLKNGEELAGCDDPDILAFYIQLAATKLLHGFQNGLLEPTQERIAKVQRMNEALQSLGRPALPIEY